MELAMEDLMLADKIHELEDKCVEPNMKEGMLAKREPTDA